MAEEKKNFKKIGFSKDVKTKPRTEQIASISSRPKEQKQSERND